MNDNFPQPPQGFDRSLTAMLVSVGLFALFGFISVVN
jgi:hypothetical protein